MLTVPDKNYKDADASAQYVNDSIKVNERTNGTNDDSGDNSIHKDGEQKVVGVAVWQRKGDNEHA